MSSNGNNFATKILKLLKEKELIKVVNDQIGSPTTTGTLAKAIWDTIKSNIFSAEKIKFLELTTTVMMELPVGMISPWKSRNRIKQGF